MQQREHDLDEKAHVILKRIKELRESDKECWRNPEYHQLEVYLDQIKREFDHVRKMERLKREQQNRNFGL